MENFNSREFKSLRVLLVEDEPFLRKATEHVLSNFGFTNIYIAENGEQALDVFDSTDIDLLLTDIQMPILNGLELLRTVRSGYGHLDRSLPVIIFTGLDDIETLGSAIALDVNGFLIKPIKPETFFQAILKALSEQEVELKEKSRYLEVATNADGPRSDTGQIDSNAMEPIEVDRDKAISVHALRPGMLLSRDVVCSTGDLLLYAGATLNQRMISRLIELDSVIQVEGYYIEPS